MGGGKLGYDFPGHAVKLEATPRKSGAEKHPVNFGDRRQDR